MNRLRIIFTTHPHSIYIDLNITNLIKLIALPNLEQLLKRSTYLIYFKFKGWKQKYFIINAEITIIILS